MASPARDRLVDTADRLFYAHGVRAVGIDRVIAEAGVAKATLYAHFPTKGDLILAVLRHREAANDAYFDAAVPRHGGGLRGFFAALGEWFLSPGFRGCAFQNVAAELADPGHPAVAFVREHKDRFYRRLDGWVPAAAVPAVRLLTEGAIQAAGCGGDPDAADTARRAAEKLVATAKG